MPGLLLLNARGNQFILVFLELIIPVVKYFLCHPYAQTCLGIDSFRKEAPVVQMHCPQTMETVDFVTLIVLVLALGVALVLVLRSRSSFSPVTTPLPVV